MDVHPYEKAWMAASVVIVALFAGSVFVSAVGQGIEPPSNVETIDPVTARQDPRFATTGVRPGHDGVEVVLLAQVWSFIPAEVRVPAGVPVTFRITSPDVIHGFQVVGTNVNTMVVPGYVSQVTTRFDRPGEYLYVCNEFCGAAHHVMGGKLIVEAP